MCRWPDARRATYPRRESSRPRSRGVSVAARRSCSSEVASVARAEWRMLSRPNRRPAKKRAGGPAVTGGANAEITDSAHPEATVRAAESHVISLRPVQDGDLDVLFAHQADPVAAEMAAFPARDRPQFDAHWARIRLDPAVVTRTILADGVVAGNIGCWAD